MTLLFQNGNHLPIQIFNGINQMTIWKTMNILMKLMLMDSPKVFLVKIYPFYRKNNYKILYGNTLSLSFELSHDNKGQVLRFTRF